MKQLYFLIVFLPFLSVSQTDSTIDSVGIDDKPILNSHELAYTHFLLSSSELIYALNGKIILFLNGNYGHNQKSKSSFFNDDCKPWTAKNDLPHIDIIELSPIEKQEIGYDVILISWSKIPAAGNARKKFIKTAKEVLGR